MTKRLTPEEDAKELYGNLTGGGIKGTERRGGFAGETDEIVIQIDKRSHEMEITREGERFLEVRFKRREPTDAGKVASTVEEAHQAYMDREQNKQARKINFAGPAQQRYFESLSRVDREQFRRFIEGDWNLDG